MLSLISSNCVSRSLPTSTWLRHNDSRLVADPGFPGNANPERGQPIIRPNFPENCMKIKKNRHGVRVKIVKCRYATHPPRLQKSGQASQVKNRGISDPQKIIQCIRGGKRGHMHTSMKS